MNRGMVGALIVASVLAAACTKPNPAFCSSDEDCPDAAKPFCDVAGEFAESDHVANTCTVRPAGCSIERCGCTAGEGLSCDLDQLTACNADGHSITTTTCALGCSTEARCLTFDPLNGLAAPLADAAAQPDVVLPPGTRIDTSTGQITDSANVPISVVSAVVMQTGGSSIQVFMARSFVIDDALIEGTRSFAFVAPGPITVKGIVDASASRELHGPGGQDSPAACVGGPGEGSSTAASGGGGGGNATPGGAGGGFSADVLPGAAIPGFEPLVGGCRGGTVAFADTSTQPGGGGGGSGHLVSLSEIAFIGSGVINVGGGGGKPGGGGGSGGTVILESPQVRLEGLTTGIYANGGAGGGCSVDGADASPSATVAAAPKCSPASAGNGGTAVITPQNGERRCTSTPCTVVGFQGGGGGSVGRVRIATKTGSFGMTGGSTISAVVSTATLVAK